MRTTVTIDDVLLEQLKKRAAERGTTVSEVIEDSVRMATAHPASGTGEEVPFQLVTFGRGGAFTHLEVDKVSLLLEEEDLELHGRRR